MKTPKMPFDPDPLSYSLRKVEEVARIRKAEADALHQAALDKYNRIFSQSETSRLYGWATYNVNPRYACLLQNIAIALCGSPLYSELARIPKIKDEVAMMFLARFV